MTEPLNAATSSGGRRRTARTFGAAADRLTGRWPATEQLTEPTLQPAPDNPSQPGPDGVVASLRPRSDQSSPVSAEVEVEATAEADVAQERLATFAERMVAVNASFSNPSTGETSVDGPLISIDAHELRLDTDAPVQRLRAAAPRQR